MTLIEVIKAIEAVASNQPAIGMIVENDVFRLNTLKSAKYGVFAFVQGQHSADVQSDLITFNFNFFYVDRLTDGDANQLEIQSTGVEVLSNIINTLYNDGMEITSYNFTSFNQRFTDECAGVYTNVSISVAKGSICAEEYSFNDNVEVV